MPPSCSRRRRRTGAASILSIHVATADAAVLVAGLVGLALSSPADPAALDAWGWRVAFLLGALIVPFGLALRRTLAETLPAEAARAGAAAAACGHSSSSPRRAC